MKKIIIGAIVALLLGTSAVSAEVLTRNNVGTYNFTWNLTINKAQFNNSNQLIGYKGFSLGYFGYHSKTYKKPVETGAATPFFVWGTGGLIFPFIGWGYDYYINKSFSIGGSLNTGLWIIPVPVVSAAFHF